MYQVQRRRRQMARRPTRPLGYILIPTSLGISLVIMTKRSHLRALIVNPSSPSHKRDFAIAFLAQPKPPSTLSRCTSATGEKVKRRVGKAGEGVRKAKNTMPVTSPTTWNFGWRWRTPGYLPFAIPISVPATQSEFNTPPYPSSSLYPGEKKKTSKVMVVVMTVFVLVFCHMLAHFFARASLASPVPDFSSTSPFASSTRSLARIGFTTIDVEAPAVRGARAATSGKTAAAKAFAYLGKLDMQEWLGWVVKGKKRSP